MTLFHPFVLDNAAGQETVVGIGSDSEKYGVGISEDIHITGIQTVDGFLNAKGGIKDTSGDMGTSGQVLSSTGTGLNWINAGDANVSSASNVGTNDASSTNSTHYLAFIGATSGNNPVRVDTSLQYNPSINQLKFNDAGSLLIKQSDETDYNWTKGIQIGHDTGSPSPILMFAYNGNGYISDRGNELRITSDSSPIRIRTLNYGGDPETGDDIATFNPGHSVDLFYTGTKRFSTSGVGATTFGNLDVTGSISGTNYLISSSNFSLTGGTINNVLVVGGSSVSGGEGGEMQLTMPPTTNLSGNSIILDAQTNSFRVFEQSGNNRGFYLDLTTAANSASGKIWHDGNDGPSSGLNADKLDDVEGSSFLRSDAANTATGLTNFVSSFIAEAVVKDDITTRTAGGFFETNTATTTEGWPVTSNNWYHLLNSTHSNTANYYSMQIAGDFFTQNNFYIRSTNNSGTQAWSKIWTSSSDGPGSGLHADLFDGIDKSGSVTDYSSLTSSSLIMMGNTFGSVFRIYYDNFNQFATMQSGDSSTRNFGNIDIRSGRGGLSQTDNPYYASGGNTGSVTGSSIKISHNSGELVLGCATGNFNLTQASGNHRGFKVYLDGRIDHVTKGTYGMKMVHRGSSSSFKQVVFEETGGTEIGSITINNTANTTSFNETSDYRIKENVVGITSALDKINQLRPVNFNFIGKSVKLDGFLAHEVQAVIPYAVSGEKDAVKTVKDGDLSDEGTKEDAERIAALPTKEVPDLQQLDKSKLITLLTASVQELSAKNDALEARIKALESS